MNIEDLKYTTTETKLVEVTKTVSDFYSFPVVVPTGWRATELRILKLGDNYMSNATPGVILTNNSSVIDRTPRVIVEKIPKKKKRWIVEQLNENPRDSTGYTYKNSGLLYGEVWVRVVGEVSEDEYGNE